MNTVFQREAGDNEIILCVLVFVCVCNMNVSFFLKVYK